MAKSMFPNFKELGEGFSKLFKDVKNSVTEIVSDYQHKHGKKTSTKKTTTKKKSTTSKEAKK